MASLLAVTCAADISYTSNQTVTEPLVLTEPITIDVASGVTVTYSGGGVISGEYLITKTGDGTLALATANPDFSGGITVTAGAVRMDVEGAFGTGPLTSTAASTATRVTRGFIFNAANATVANAITVNLANNDASVDWCYHLQATKNTRFTGGISSIGTGQIRIGDASDGSVTTIVECAMSGLKGTTKRDIFLYQYGRLDIKGPITAGNIQFYNNAYSARVREVHLWYPGSSHVTSGNYITKYQNHFCEDDNVLPYTAAIGWNSAKSDPTTHNIDLQGHSQTLRGLHWNSGEHLGPGLDGARILSTGNPATLTLTGGTDNYTTYCRLMDEISVVMDRAGKRQTFANRTSPTTGSLIVSNGVVALSEAQTFPNMKRVFVGANGTLNLNGTVPGAFAGAEEVEVEGGGTLSFATTSLMPFSQETTVLRVSSTSKIAIPDGMTVGVAKLYVDGIEMPETTYTSESWLTSTGSLEVRCLAVSAGTWTAGASPDDAVSKAANWGGTLPDIASGGLNATVSAGSHMELDDPFSFLSLSFTDAVAGFTVDGDETLTAGGDVTAAGVGTACTWTFAAPLALNGVTSWTFPSTDTLKLTGGISGSGSLEVSAKRTELSGDNPFAGAFSLKSGSLLLSGTMGPSGDTASFSQQTTAGAITFTNATTINKYMSFRGNNSSFVMAADATATLNGKISLLNQLTPVMPSSAHLVVNGEIWYDNLGYEPGNSCRGKVTFNVAPYFRNSGQIVKPLVGTHEWCLRSESMKPANFYATSGSATNVFGAGCNRVVKIAENAADNVTRTCGEFLFASESGVCDLNGTTQWFCRADGVAGTLMSRTPATLEVIPISKKTAWEPVGIFGPKVEGPVSILFGPRKGAEHAVMTLTNRVFASTGDITVTNGTLVIAANASWPNGTNVTVKGDGVLKLESGTAFNDDIAVIRFAENGMVHVPAGVTQTFAEGWDGATKLVSGRTYTAAILPSRISGEGAIRIAALGTAVFLR